MRHIELGLGIICVAVGVGCGDPVSSGGQSAAATTASTAAAPSPSVRTTSATATASAGPTVSSSPSASADPLGGYLLYEDKAGGYSIMLPAKPAPKIETPVDRNGTQVVEHTVPLRIGSSVYSISYTDGTGGPELTQPGLKAMLLGPLRQTFADLGATLDATVDVQNGDHAGLEGRGTHPTQGKVRARVFEVRTKTTARQYRIVMMGDQPDEVAKALLDSFTIKM